MVAESIAAKNFKIGLVNGFACFKKTLLLNFINK